MAALFGTILKETLLDFPRKNVELLSLEKTRAYIETMEHARRLMQALLGGIFLIHLSLLGIGLGCAGLVLERWPMTGAGIGLFAAVLSLFFLLTSEGGWMRWMKIDRMTRPLRERSE